MPLSPNPGALKPARVTSEGCGSFFFMAFKPMSNLAKKGVFAALFVSKGSLVCIQPEC